MHPHLTAAEGQDPGAERGIGAEEELEEEGCGDRVPRQGGRFAEQSDTPAGS